MGTTNPSGALEIAPVFKWSFCLSLWPITYFGHCVVCSSSIYGFWLTLWYLQTFFDIFSYLLWCPLRFLRFKLKKSNFRFTLISLVGVRILSILFVITLREENVNLAYFKIDIEIFDVYNNELYELYVVDLLVRVKG